MCARGSRFEPQHLQVDVPRISWNRRERKKKLHLSRSSPGATPSAHPGTRRPAHSPSRGRRHKAVRLPNPPPPEPKSFAREATPRSVKRLEEEKA